MAWCRRIINRRPRRNNEFKKKYVLTAPYYYDHNTRNSPSSPTPRDSEKKRFHPPRLQPFLETRCRGRRSRNPPFPEEREKDAGERKYKRKERERDKRQDQEDKNVNNLLLYVQVKLWISSPPLPLLLITYSSFSQRCKGEKRG